MEIDYAIVASDESHYLDYWPIVSKAWKKIGIKPVLIRINSQVDEWSYDHSHDSGLIIDLPQIPFIKPSLQAQIGRIWAYKLLSGNCIMSDMDMYPISEAYFKGIAKKYDDTQIVSYCADAAKLFEGHHPMCYILANSEVMSKLITQTTWEQFVIHLAEIGGQGWSTDQWHITNLLATYDKVVSLERGWNKAGQADHRLDRIDWKFSPHSAKGYYDAHLPNPYMKNKQLIEKFLQYID